MSNMHYNEVVQKAYMTGVYHDKSTRKTFILC